MFQDDTGEGVRHQDQGSDRVQGGDVVDLGGGHRVPGNGKNTQAWA